MNFGIIAAGEGSRLRSEGVEFPKPLVPIDGELMIGRLINIFKDCGAASFGIIVNEEMKEVQEYLYEIIKKSELPFDLIVKSTPSSMHSFYELSKGLGEKGKFIVTTVDTIFRKKDFANYAEYFRSLPNDIDGVMAVTPFIDDEKPLYVATDEDMNITGFLDQKEGNVRFVSGGIYGLTQSAIPVLEKCIKEGVSRMRNFQRALVASGLRLKAYEIEKILDVDHASDILKAEEFLSNR